MIHNSHEAFYRIPAGPAAAGTTVTFRFRDDDAKQVILRTWTGEETQIPMTPMGGGVWEADFTTPAEPGLMWYDFIVDMPDGSRLRYGNAADKMGGEGMVYEQGEFHSFQLTLYKPNFKTPGFMQGANIYQIFPDRFWRAKTKAVDDRTDRHIHEKWDEDLLTDSDPRSGDHMALDFFGGNLNGIRKKLPYLKDLGVTVIYLNPIFRARSNHRYDTGDYTQIDPLLGTEEEFTELCKAAEEQGMRVMLDGVFSHTGEDSLYFNHFGNYDSIGACQGEESPYYDWYTFKHFPDEYACWWGIPSLPECRKNNPDYQKFMFKDKEGIVPRWILRGSSGWRLDVADELSMDFLRKLRVAAKRAKRDAVVLGEVWEDASAKISYGELRCYCTGDTLDSVMNYPLREAILDFVTGKTDASALVRLIHHQAEVYPAQFRYALMNLIGSHDRARVLNVLCGREGNELSKAEQQALRLTEEEYELATQRYRTCIDILCALPGCPTIYYGDEAGLTGCRDPFCRRPFPWGHEDKKLQKYVAEKLNQHKQSALRKFGYCTVDAVDADTIRIVRSFTTTDALGRKAPQADAKEEIVVRR
jgi:cyclomaltodextrinase / maltogenic alpha-amylase / neopullulanase